MLKKLQFYNNIFLLIKRVQQNTKAIVKNRNNVKLPFINLFTIITGTGI